MHDRHLERWQHHHDFLPRSAERAERRTWMVIVLTSSMMLVEIGAGSIYNSMALLADGWHMASHAAALGITAFAYLYARRHRADPRYSFGTGKVSVLGGYTSAVVLAVIALSMAYSSVERFIWPQRIAFDQALIVAGVGLGTNLLSAWLLSGAGSVEQGHGHGHGHGSAKLDPRDHNLRAAYLHVLADALTSVLAIVALLCGKLWGWHWLDPAMGLVGAALILRWSRGLLVDSGRILLDRQDSGETRSRILSAIESDGDSRVCDLHVWRVSPHHAAAVVSVVAAEPKSTQQYRSALRGLAELAHVTVEVHRCTGQSPEPA
jgi:cation diffusion facilitator family transporter